ncbi:MAG: DUF2304 domain-containing protein [Eubacteriales bacterium]|nr:DUF2304 domain-containing protein [Eubacteriales bacterium]MDD3881146.1 DUF2304 domain-containing protein [Eubacteriales bacterium]MDD4511528.1 DUF2304 domain-containing protein [Eubacteriales bacterium]
MSVTLRIVVILSGLLVIGISIRGIVNRVITEKQSLFWLFLGVVMILFGAFPGLCYFIADFFGVDYAPSIIFMICIVLALFGIFYCFRQCAKLYKRVQELAIQVSMLNNENVELRKRERDDREAASARRKAAV